jgi:glycosyltransferase involved in cell wall biosynthesis
MRVLIVHNRYRSEMPSGENRVVDRDIEALVGAGVDVESYIRESDEISSFGPLEKLGLAARPIHSPTDTRRILTLVDQWGPDVVHFHNPYPLISPSFVRRLRARPVAVVQTIHNYRHVCVNGWFFRDGAPCHDCEGRRVPIPAIRHACYRDSRAESVVMAATLVRHRSTWQDVDLFVAVNGTIADFLRRDLDIAADRVVVRPNSLPDPGPVQPPGEGFLYVGRLEEFKGIRQLLDAWRTSAPRGWTLTLAGDGPERDHVEEFAASRPDVSYVGSVDQQGVRALMDACRVVVIPSVAYESMPMVLVEAFSRGRPILGTGHGALADLIDPSVGWLCEPTAESLGAAFGRVAEGPVPAPAAPRARFDSQYRGDDAAGWLVGQYARLIGMPQGAS